MADQPFWGRLIYEMGLDPKLIPQYNLNADRLAEAIHLAVSDQTMQEQAAAMGTKIRAEDGVARAVEVIGEVMHRQRVTA